MNGPPIMRMHPKRRQHEDMMAKHFLNQVLSQDLGERHIPKAQIVVHSDFCNNFGDNYNDEDVS